MAEPKRIQRKMLPGWRMPEGAVYVGRPSRWGNGFKLGTPSALMRVPAALDPSADCEYESRSSAHGARHDYMHPDGHWTQHTVRYMTAAESVDHYRRLLVDELTPSMISAGFRPGQGVHVRRGLRTTLAQVQAELAGKDLACWCPLDQPCHADVLLEMANPCFAVNRWNGQHPIGTMVRAYPGTRDGRSVVGPTRSPAWALGAAPVVLVEGLSGGIALTHVDVEPVMFTEPEERAIMAADRVGDVPDPEIAALNGEPR